MRYICREPGIQPREVAMGDQDPSPSLSRRTLLTGGIAAALTATAAGTLPVAEEDAEALRPFNYPSGGTVTGGRATSRTPARPSILTGTTTTFVTSSSSPRTISPACGRGCAGAPVSRSAAHWMS